MSGEHQHQLTVEGRVLKPEMVPVPDAGLDLAEPADREAPFYRSIRFRLTLWYAAALVVVVAAMGVSLHSLLERALTSDAEARLRTAALDISRDFKPDVSTAGRFPDGSIDFSTVDLLPVNVDSIVLTGIWFQIVDARHEPVELASSGAVRNAPANLEAALGDNGVYTRSQVLRTIEVGGRTMLVLVVPLQVTVNGVPVEGSNAGWLVVGEPLGSREDIIDVVDSILRILGVIGVAVAAWGGWMLAGHALAPLGRLTNTAESIAGSDGSVAVTKRLEVPASGDELTQLAATFNLMLDRIESAFNNQRRFVGDASHELRTPLTSVRGNVDVLMRQLRAGRPIEREDLIDVLGVVQRESGRMSRLIEDLLLLARSDASGLDNLIKREPVQLDFVAREAFRTAEQLASGQRLVLDVAGSPVVSGDRDRLVQLVLIFLDNAIRHTPEGGTITVTVDSAEDTESGGLCARVRVSDTGSGIAPKHIPHLFERFYRAENARTRLDGGTGLGLSIALSIVRGHHGWIDVNSIVDEGTSFTVWLPLEAAPGSNQSEPPVKRNGLQGVRTAVSDRWSALVNRLRRRP